MQQQCRHGPGRGAVSLLVVAGSLQLASAVHMRMRSAASMNPLEKTIELITSLQGGVVADGQREGVAYTKYARWCKDTTWEKSIEVKSFTKQKSKLEADIQMAGSEIEASTTKIEELGNDVSENEKKLKEITEARGGEHDTFVTVDHQLMETIDMLARAVEMLEKEMQSSSPALVQATIDTDNLENMLLGLGAVIDAAGIDEDTSKLAALIQARQDTRDSDADELSGAPSAAAYESHSQGIIDVMEDMRDKAEEQLRKARDGEAKLKQNYLLIKQSVEDQIANLEKDMKDEKSDKASSEESKATAEGDLSVAAKELAASSSATKNTQASCLRTAADHEVSLEGRKRELMTLAKAKKTIQNSMASPGASSFMQVAATATAKAHAHSTALSKQVVKFIKRLAQTQKSSELSQLASRLVTVVRFGISTGKDPFSKVKKMIVEMIKKLEGEMGAEAKEKAYCDSELMKAEEQRQELKDKIDGLQGRNDQAESKSTALKSDVKDLQQELAQLAKQQAELDASRTETREAFLNTKKDLQQSLDGTRTAIRLLREYYANDDKDGDEEDAELLQSSDGLSNEMNQPQAPQSFEKSKGAGGSIIGILELCEGDLSKSLAEEQTEEAGKQTEYEKLTREAVLLKVQKAKDVQYKVAEYKALDKSITEFSSDLDTESEELQAVQEYLAKVQERCIAKPESYEARKERRDAEIKGLREAQALLMNTALVQKKAAA